MSFVLHVQPLKEYHLYIESIREALVRRDAIQLDYELSVEEMSKKKSEKDHLTDLENRSSPSSAFNLWKSAAERLTREDKLDKLNLAIPRLVKMVEVRTLNLFVNWRVNKVKVHFFNEISSLEKSGKVREFC